MTKPDQLRLLLLGLAAGDSLGSTSEFVDREDVPAVYARNKPKGWPFRQVGGGAFGWQPGEPTDDTDMAMCLVRSFTRKGTFDGEDAAKEFVGWLNTTPPDVGMATRRGLAAVRSGTPWFQGGLAEYHSNGRSAANGSLMRNGVTPAMASSLEDAFRIALHQSIVTHYGLLPVLCCAAQSYLIWELLAGRDPFDGNWLEAFERSFLLWLGRTDDPVAQSWRDHVDAHLDVATEILREANFDPDSFNPFTLDFGHADGYCLLTLQIAVWAAQWCLRSQPFPTPKGFPAEIFQKTGPYVLAWVAMIGHDSDTYGAAAGPLIAAACGRVPDELTDGLLVKLELDDLGLSAKP